MLAISGSVSVFVTLALATAVTNTTMEESNCTTTHEALNAWIQETVSRVQVSSLQNDFHISCTLTLASEIEDQISNHSTCVNSTAVKLFVQQSAWTPRLFCKSNHLIKLEFQYLDGHGPTLHTDGFVFSQWHNESTYSITLSPEKPASVRYIMTGQVETDGGVHPWTETPISMLILYARTPEIGADDVLIYSGTQRPFQVTAEEDWALIPCFAGAVGPNAPVPFVEGVACRQLQANVTYDHMQGVHYDVRSGPDYLSERFFCGRKANACSQPSQEFYFIDPPTFELSPKIPVTGDPLRLFSTEGFTVSLRIKCVSWATLFGSHVNFRGTLEPGGFNITRSNYTAWQTRSWPRERYAASMKMALRVGDWLQAECVSVSSERQLETGGGLPVYEWNVTVHSAEPTAQDQDSAYLKFLEGPLRWIRDTQPAVHRPVFQCYSNVYTDVSLDVVDCYNAEQCRLLEWCFESVQCHAVLTKGTACLELPPHPSKSCQEAQIQSPGGLFRCSAGGHTYTHLRWQNLNGNKSFVFNEDDKGPWSESLQQEMIHLEGPRPAPSVYYANLTYNFTCITHPFWSAGRVRFYFGFTDEERPLEAAEGPTESVNKAPGKPLSFIEHIQWIIPDSTVNKIVCMAPVLGREKAWISAIFQLPNVTESSSPEIQNAETEFVFEDDGLPKTIPCIVSSLPPSTIRWFKRFVNDEGDELPGVEIRSVPDAAGLSVVNGSILHFKQFRKELDGTYTCIAENGVGEATALDFRASALPIKDPPGLSPWAVTGIAGGAFLLILASVFLLKRRFYFRRVRVLDKVIMDKFRYGRDPNDSKLSSAAENEFSQTEDEPAVINIEAQINEAHLDGFIDVSARQYHYLSCNRVILDVEQQPFDTRFEIRRRRISIDRSHLLGEGEYGKVYAGTVRIRSESHDSPGQWTTINVAVKTAKRNCPEDILRCMLAEVKVMTQLQHENLVSLIGANTSMAEYGRLYILMEYCEEGSLDEYFKRNRRQLVNSGVGNHYLQVWSPSFRNMVRWCAEVASGMEFLSLLGFVHRDLAARNILLTAMLTAKVADFGLSRHLDGSNYYKQKTLDLKLPCRWLAVECFSGRFWTPSDVWAFGILAWEIFSVGSLPYSDFGFTESSEFENHIRKGARISEPHQTTPEIFAKLQACWLEDASRRPSFTQLKDFFTDLMYESE